MNFKKTLFAVGLVSVMPLAAFAQNNTTTDSNRDLKQQERIQQGLQSGQLSTQEAGKLEQNESHISNMQQNAEQNGKISAEEQAKISAAQGRTSRQTTAAKHNGTTVDPDSKASQRMQENVDRNVSQQQRINDGINNGELSHKEAGNLQARESRATGDQAQAAANGHISAHNQKDLQKQQDRDSERVYNQKHDKQQH